MPVVKVLNARLGIMVPFAHALKVMSVILYQLAGQHESEAETLLAFQDLEDRKCLFS